MNEAALRAEILNYLGHPILCVELNPELLSQVLRGAYRWFSSKKGIKARDQLTLTEGINEYSLPATVLDVIDVYPPIPIDATEAFYGDTFGSYGGIYVGGSGFGGAGVIGGAATPFGGRFGGRDLEANRT